MSKTVKFYKNFKLRGFEPKLSDNVYNTEASVSWTKDKLTEAQAKQLKINLASP